MTKMTVTVAFPIEPAIECMGVGSHSSKVAPSKHLAQRIEVSVTGDDAFDSGAQPHFHVRFTGMKGQRPSSYFSSEDEALAPVRRLAVERALTAFQYATTIQEPT